MFLTGVIGLVASCVRWAVLVHNDADAITPHDSVLVYTIIIECSTYLIAACLPASYPVLNLIIPSKFRNYVEDTFNKILPKSMGSPAARAGGTGLHRNQNSSFLRLVDTSRPHVEIQGIVFPFTDVHES